MRNEYDYRGQPRFVTPNSQEQVVNPYDQDSRLFQDLEQRGLVPVFVQTINLSTAGSLLVNQPGFHFVCYGHDGSNIKTVNTTALVNVWINKQTNDGSTPYPAKHARGYSGPYAKLYLEWPAQNNIYVDLVIFKGAEKPWIDGETCT